MNYLIDYEFYDKNGNKVKSGMMRVKNANNELHAKVKLEKYLALKYPTFFNRLVVHKCTPDVPDIFTQIFGGFK